MDDEKSYEVDVGIGMLLFVLLCVVVMILSAAVLTLHYLLQCSWVLSILIATTIPVMLWYASNALVIFLSKRYEGR